MVSPDVNPLRRLAGLRSGNDDQREVSTMANYWLGIMAVAFAAAMAAWITLVFRAAGTFRTGRHRVRAAPRGRGRRL